MKFFLKIFENNFYKNTIRSDSKMNNCVRCVHSGKNYFRIPNYIGHYLQKCSKNTAGVNSKNPNGSSDSSSSSSESDDPNVKSIKNKNEEKLKRLNELLMKLVEQDNVMKKSQIDLAQPPNKRKKEKSKSEVNAVETEDKNIVNVVKDVATQIGGDPKITETELLTKLLKPEETSAPKTLMDIIKGMQIDRETTYTDKTRAEQVRNILQKADSRIRIRAGVKEKQITSMPLPRTKAEQVTHRIDLFGGEGLGIFSNADKLEMSTETKTWENLKNRDLRLAITHPPANYFQQLILWTEQKKLWKFPIDNEQGLDEEKTVHFSQHVFLEELLEPWCPEKGPIRHFMELVCVGLSKNSYLTVQAKKDHIEWFRNYFDGKKALLEEVGALQSSLGVDGQAAKAIQQTENSIKTSG